MKNRYKFFFFLFLFISVKNVCAQTYVISTIAGNGIGGHTGDGGPSASAQIFNPFYIKTDDTGNVYFGDGHSIRKIDTAGVIHTLAGIYNMSGYSGDGGLATLAKLSFPSCGIPHGGGDGYLYIADDANDVIRRVHLGTGIISTVYGTTTGYGGDGGSATAALFYNPIDLTFDKSGNLYIVDMTNRRVRKVSTAGIITTIAGNGSKGSSGDGGPATAASLGSVCVAIDSKGNIYATDTNSLVRRIDAVTGIITRYAGNGIWGFSGDGGPAISAQLGGPQSICFDTADNMYIADKGNNRIRKIEALTGIITTIAGKDTMGYNGDGILSISAQLKQPYGVAVDRRGNVYITDNGNKRIRKLTPVDTTTDVPNTITESDIKIYPNPAHQTITVRSVAAGQYIITNVAGKIVLQGRLTAFSQQINITTLQKGIYILQLINKEGLKNKCSFVKD